MRDAFTFEDDCDANEWRLILVRLRGLIRMGYVVSPRGDLCFQVPLQEGSAWGLDWNVATHRYVGAPGFGHGVS